MDPLGHADKVHQQIAASGVPILQTTDQHVPPLKLLHLRTVDWPCGCFFLCGSFTDTMGFDLVVCSSFLLVVFFIMLLRVVLLLVVVVAVVMESF